MDIIKLIRLKKSITCAIEASRGVDMATYTALVSAGKSMDEAIYAAEKHRARKKNNPTRNPFRSEERP